MSIEIEVGLENAPRVPINLQEPPPVESPKGLKNPKVQRFLIAGVIAVLVIATGLFLYYRNRESRMTHRWTATSRQSRRRFPAGCKKCWCMTTNR